MCELKCSQKKNFQLILETEIIMIVLFKRYKHNLNVTVYYNNTRVLLHYQSNKRYKTKVIQRKQKLLLQFRFALVNAPFVHLKVERQIKICIMHESNLALLPLSAGE